MAVMRHASTRALSFPAQRARALFWMARHQKRITMTALLLFLRGPLLMVAVVSAIAMPHLLELSTRSFIFLLLFAAGLFLTAADTIALAESTLQRRVSSFLNTVVLNNVLKSWFDPETGWFACWTAFLLGNATMYALPISDDQRIRLVESSLAVSNQQAQRILTTPGGFQELLPENIQIWLNGKSVEGNETRRMEEDESKSTAENHECDQSDQTDETDPMSEAETPSRRRTDGKEENEPVPCSRGLRQTRDDKNDISTPPTIVQHPTPPQYPIDVLGGILKETGMNIIKQACLNMSDSKIQGIAIAASAAFCLQMYKSPRSRRIVSGAIQGSAALTFASVTVGAIAALVTKARVLDSPLGGQRQELSFLSGMLARLRQVGGVRRVQGMIAVLILWYVGRRRTKSLQSNVHR